MTHSQNHEEVVEPFVADLVAEIAALSTDTTRSSKKLEELLVVGLTIYGMTGSDELVPHISGAYRFALTKLHPHERFNIWRYINARLSKGELRFDTLVPLMIWDSDDAIASTASLDLVAFSPLDDQGVPTGLRMVCQHLERGVANPGAVVGGLVVMGDSNLMPAVSPLRNYLKSHSAIAAAARCRSGRLFHASVDFWLSWAEELVPREDDASQSAFGLCATALVNLRTTAATDSVIDAYRLYPSRNEDSIQLKREWTMASYAKHIAPRLYALEAEESSPKVMDQVIIAWELKARSEPAERAFHRDGQRYN